MTESWDAHFLREAYLIAIRSKDPKRKVGCVIVDYDKIQLSAGFNGFPRGIADDARLQDKETKLRIIVHAEMNAIAAAARKGHSLKGGIAYVTLRPCPQCASLLIQAGIHKVITPAGVNETSNIADCDFAEALLVEAGILINKVRI